MKGPGTESQQLVTQVLPTVTGKELEPCAPAASLELTCPQLSTPNYSFPTRRKGWGCTAWSEMGLWGGGKRARGSVTAPPVGLMKEHPVHSTSVCLSTIPRQVSYDCMQCQTTRGVTARPKCGMSSWGRTWGLSRVQGNW